MFHENEGFSALFWGNLWVFQLPALHLWWFFCCPSTSKAGTATAPPNLRDPQLEDAMLREVTGVFFSPYINTFFVGSQI